MTRSLPLRSPKTETITVSELRKNLAETMRRVEEGEARYIVERAGRPSVALVADRELRYLDERQSIIDRGWDAVNQIRDAFAEYSEQEVEDMVTEAIREVDKARRGAH